MAVQVPTPTQLREVAEEIGLSLSDADVTSFIELIRPSIGAYNVVDAMPDNLPEVRYPRTPGTRPARRVRASRLWITTSEHKYHFVERPRPVDRHDQGCTEPWSRRVEQPVSTTEAHL